MNKKNILFIKDVSKWRKKHFYSKQHIILDKVSFKVSKGECVVVIGHNGAGKTTLFKILVGLIKMNCGYIDCSVKIGYMPEIQQLTKELTPWQLLTYHSLLLGIKKQFVESSLQLVELDAYKNIRVVKLSKGLSRRTAWALAQLPNPPLYILDEPFSGMDPYSQYKMISWLKDEKKRGKTIVLSTHNLEIIPLLADKVIIMSSGRVVDISSANNTVERWISFFK